MRSGLDPIASSRGTGELLAVDAINIVVAVSFRNLEGEDTRTIYMWVFGSKRVPIVLEGTIESDSGCVRLYRQLLPRGHRDTDRRSPPLAKKKAGRSASQSALRRHRLHLVAELEVHGLHGGAPALDVVGGRGHGAVSSAQHGHLHRQLVKLPMIARARPLPVGLALSLPLGNQASFESFN